MVSRFKLIIYFITVLFILLLYSIYYFGFRMPPEYIKAVELESIKKIKTFHGQLFNVNDEDLKIWHSLVFRKSTIDEYPGETPDYHIKLITDNAEYSAIYNKDSKFVFFSFFPNIRYGFFTEPPPGGWTQPLYVSKVDSDLLKLIRYRY